MLTSWIKTIVADEDGVTAIEYALIAALVALLLVTSLGTLRAAISTAFTNVAAAI